MLKKHKILIRTILAALLIGAGYTVNTYDENVLEGISTVFEAMVYEAPVVEDVE